MELVLSDHDIRIGIRNFKNWKQWKDNWTPEPSTDAKMLPGQVIEILFPVRSGNGCEDRYFPAMVTDNPSCACVEIQWCQHTRSQYEVAARVENDQRSSGERQSLRDEESKVHLTFNLHNHHWRSKESHSTTTDEDYTGYARNPDAPVTICIVRHWYLITTQLVVE